MTERSTAVVSVGLSNVQSVCRALASLSVDHVMTDRPEGLRTAKRIILPGVGSFHEAARRLEASGLRAAIRDKVLGERTPILGICLGMQLLATRGEEGGPAAGLGLIEATVRALPTSARLPHVGWNEVCNRGMPLLEQTRSGTCFYFVHSYVMMPEEDVLTANCDYVADFVAAVQKGHIMGTQFHPEKSQQAGLDLLERFVSTAW